ncbi:MAG: ABC transporter ATP-binding protein, partial [Bacteroidota bacterium]
MLTFHRVSFGYHEADTVLQDVSFTLPPGSCTILAGRNGTGKSTIVQLANGLLRPRSGEIRIRGVSTADLPTSAIVRDVGVMFQHPGDQLTERTITREVAVGVRALHLDHPNERVRAAIDLVELRERASSHPYDLEPAERKLVTLASIVAMRTPVVFLDEPLVSLGPAETRIVENVVRQLQNEGRTVLIVVHDVVQAWPLADR